MYQEHARPKPPSFLEFNKEILFGECGAFLLAYGAAFLAADFTHNAAIISGSVVVGTLLGGTVFWLAARIFHKLSGNRWSPGSLVTDIGYFTPAALTLGFLVYDPAIYFASHYFLVHSAGVGHSVLFAQLIAFTLFLASMNCYRAILMRSGLRRL
jgi:hypothetical protein